MNPTDESLEVVTHGDPGFDRELLGSARDGAAFAVTSFTALKEEEGSS
jgi:hypothetical protein